MMFRRTGMVVAAVAVVLAVAAARGYAQAGAPLPTGTGTLVVVVDPPAALYVDGNLVTADATRQEVPVPAGLHRVRIVHPDYQDLVRRIRIEPDKTATLSLSLPERGVRKPVAAPAGRGRGATAGRGAAGRGPSANDGLPGVTDPDLLTGIQFVKDGDFEPAVDTLTAVCRNLAGTPRYVGQQAVAFLYLGAALVELDRVDLARRAFALAQRADKNLVAAPTVFSRLTLATWADARTIPGSEEIDLDTLTIVPAPAAPEPTPPPAPAPENLEPERVIDPEAPFISEVEGALLLDFAIATTAAPCLGTLMINPAQQIVSWEPKGTACLPSFDVPFAEVRSPAAAPRGGVLLQFRSARQSVTLMPAPDADLLEPDREKLTLNDLPPSTRVHTRSALKRIFRALDRSWTDSISSLLVDVPVAELTENPADYDGGIVRTSGTLVTTSTRRGPYFVSDDNAKIQIAPAGVAATMMRSKASEWVGHELIVSGAFSRPAAISSKGGTASSSPFLITATKIEPADEVKYSGPARSLTLEQIVKDPPWNRELIRVIGKYRGANSFGDMPLDSRRNSGDWVIRDSVFSVWVTGRRPAGNGFELDSSNTRDVTSFWVAVTGRVEHRRGFVYMKAEKVELSPTEFKKDPGTPAIRIGGASVRQRPDIVHIDPSESVEISPDQQMLVQFTKPMDEKTLPGNVQLRYSDGTPAAFPYLLVTYYPERHSSVIIDPGTVLIPNKTIEVVFLPGVKDVDNQSLMGTDTAPGRVLKWRVKRR